MSTYSNEPVGTVEPPLVDPITDPITDPMDPTQRPIAPDDPTGIVPDAVDPSSSSSSGGSNIPVPDGTYDSSVPTDLDTGVTGPNDMDETVSDEEVVPL